MALVVVLGACGDETTVGPNPEIAFMVGGWEARSFRVQDVEFPVLAVDLVRDRGGSFRLHVEPSGRYTAVLEVDLPQAPESGLLYLDGERLVLDPDGAEPSSNEVERVEGRVVLRGDSEFAFSRDADPVPVELMIDLEPTR